MNKTRLLLLCLGIPGLLAYGTLAAAQWKAAAALADFDRLQKTHRPDSLAPPTPEVLAAKEAALQRAARFAPDHPEPAYQAALLRLVQAESASLQPSSSEASLGAGPDPQLRALLRDALRAINRAIELNPNQADYPFVKATVFQNLETTLSPPETAGVGASVGKLLVRADRLDPYRPLLHYRLGSFWLALGNLEQAREAFTVALRKNPALARDVLAVLWSATTSPAELKQYMWHEPRVCVVLGAFLAEHGYAAEAEEEYAEATPAAKGDFRVLSALVSKYLKDENFDAVLRLVGDAEQAGEITDRRERSALRYLAGQALFRQGRIQDSISAYEAAIRIDDSQIHLHHSLAMAYLRSGDLNKATARWQFLRRRFGDSSLPASANAVMHAGLGEALERQGRQVDALAEYLKAAELDPRNASVAKKIQELSGRF